jgi:ABC-type branched-subunit amino acid transport system ATPase component
VPMSLDIADHAVVLANGRVALAGKASDLVKSDGVKSAYLAA